MNLDTQYFITDPVLVAGELDRILLEEDGAVFAIIISDTHIFSNKPGATAVRAYAEMLGLFKPSVYVEDGDIDDNQFYQDNGSYITDEELWLKDTCNAHAEQARLAYRLRGNHEDHYLEGGPEEYVAMVRAESSFDHYEAGIETTLQDPTGLIWDIEHGDRHDSWLARAFYGIGCKLYKYGQAMDKHIEAVPLHLRDQKSWLAWGKRRAKHLVINAYERNAANSVGPESHGIITGHIHKGGFKSISRHDKRQVYYANTADLPQSCAFIVMTNDGKKLFVDIPRVRLHMKYLDSHRIPLASDPKPAHIQRQRERSLAQVHFVRSEFPVWDEHPAYYPVVGAKLARSFALTDSSVGRPPEFVPVSPQPLLPSELSRMTSNLYPAPPGMVMGPYQTALGSFEIRRD